MGHSYVPVWQTGRFPAPGSRKPRVRQATGDYMAKKNLSKKNGVYLARFRFQGKEYKKSLKTTERKAADGAMHRIADALHRLAINTLVVPKGVDPGNFIISGGTLTAPSPKREPRIVPTLDHATAEYLGNLEHMAESNRYTLGVHLRNLKKNRCGRLKLDLG